MDSKKRRAYLDIAMQMPREWLIACAKEPSSHMTKAHATLCLVAARRKPF